MKLTKARENYVFLISNLITTRHYNFTSRSLLATIGPLQGNIGISEILPYDKESYFTNLSLDHSRFFPPAQYAQLYNAAPSPASGLRSAGSLAIKLAFSSLQDRILKDTIYFGKE